MKNLESIIQGYDIPEIRSAFYYLSRYLKQANFFSDYQKDFFEDTSQSSPSIKIKQLTTLLIEFIERESGKKPSDFSDDEFFYWMNEINKIEANLDPEPSKEIKKAAEIIINSLYISK
ncbi:hypothetical protein [Providencia huaxiensis]|uniref:hypothetical protein n=1 Tax=Providencia TaxID=586 RepID=UPI0012B52BCC|nr:hypothetical protein [Providencia rettgeri]MTC73500.1 hypothetical protein [Providencia sp. wls1919]HCT9038849.1 hypothetical protein [Providencia rettgeri]